MKNTKLGVYIHNGETCNFNFATNLSAHEKRIFVRTVVGALVDGINYDSVLRDIIFDYTTILMFTDVDMSSFDTVDEDGELVTDMELLENFLLETNIVEVVKANAFPTLFDQLEDAVDKSIEYRTGIHPSPLNDALASLLSTLEKKISEIDLDSAISMAQKFAGMTGKLTPKSLVNAYMNSDTHKKNVIEIEEAKKQRAEFAEDMDKAIKAVKEESKTKSKSKVKK